MFQLLSAAVLLVGAVQPVEQAPRPKVAGSAKQFVFPPKCYSWDDVLAWYADTSELVPIYSVKPTGKVMFPPTMGDVKFTLVEITDLLNEAMASQEFVLVRRQVSFTILPIKDSQYTRIELSELPKRGKTELVEVTIYLKMLDAKDTAPRSSEDADAIRVRCDSGEDKWPVNRGYCEEHSANLSHA